MVSHSILSMDRLFGMSQPFGLHHNRITLQPHANFRTNVLNNLSGVQEYATAFNELMSRDGVPHASLSASMHMCHSSILQQEEYP